MRCSPIFLALVFTVVSASQEPVEIHHGFATGNDFIGQSEIWKRGYTASWSRPASA
jgi:hypothetical protein